MRPDRRHEHPGAPTHPRAGRAGVLGRVVAPWLALAAALAIGSGVAGAQPAAGESQSVAAEDYDTDSREWNGLHTLTAVARGLGLRVEATGDVQWEAMGADDILFVLYPETRVDPGDMASFIRNGGHVLLADDFGDSIDLLGRLGMLRDQGGGVTATRFYRDLDYAPVATPMMPDHPLAADIQELTTNMPGVLTRVQGADVIFGFGPDAAVVVAGNLGRGRFVVVSDASIFINRMLQFEGNLQFVINAVRHLSREGRAMRMVLLTRDFSLTGDPVALFPSGSVRDQVSGATLDVNRMLDTSNDYLLTEWALRVSAVALALLAVFLAVWSLPSLRRDKLDGEWARAIASPRGDDFASIVARYERPARDASFALPAAVLRDTLNRALSRRLRYGDPLGAMQEPQLVDAVRAHCGDAAAETLARLHPRLKPLPLRHQAAATEGAGYVSQRDFEHLRDEVNKLLLALGESPDIS